jgi:hypothetical protein
MNSSGGFTPPGGTQDAGDVTNTLAELERKLRELEQELTSIGRRRMQPEAEALAAQATVPPRNIGRLVDEQVEMRSPSAPPLQPAPPLRTPEPPLRAPVAPPIAESSPRAPEPTPRASESSGERPTPTDAQLASLAELRRFRERLERFAKELLNDYDAVLARAMAGIAGRVPAEVSIGSAFDTPVSFGTPASSAPAPPPPAPPPAPSPEEALFEGRVELGVGPFDSISSLSAFEQRMASLPYVIDVAVRRFEAAHAVVDVRLATPVALMRELRAVLDTDFSVRQIGPGRIQLSFSDA